MKPICKKTLCSLLLFFLMYMIIQAQDDKNFASL